MDLFFNADGVGTETGLAETAGCAVSVDEFVLPRVLVVGADEAVDAAVVEARSIRINISITKRPYLLDFFSYTFGFLSKSTKTTQ